MSTNPIQPKYNANNSEELKHNIENALKNMVYIYYSLNPKSSTDELLEHLNSKLANIKIPENFPGEAYFSMELDKYVEPKYVLIQEGKIVEVDKAEIFEKVENHVENDFKDFFFRETSYYEVRYLLVLDFVDKDEPFRFEIISEYIKIFLCSNPKTFIVKRYRKYHDYGTNIPDNVNSFCKN